MRSGVVPPAMICSFDSMMTSALHGLSERAVGKKETQTTAPERLFSE
jgi:hypothetical protein